MKRFIKQSAVPFLFLGVGVISVFLMSCGKSSDDTADNSTSSTTEAAVSSTSGAADEQSGSSFAFHDTSDFLEAPLRRLGEIVNEKEAWAGDCLARAKDATCSNGVRTQTVDCTVGSFSRSGTVTLTYSQSACTLTSAGDTVTRTNNMTRSTSFGSVTVSSDTYTAYDGTSLGGGVKITRSAAGTGTSGSFTITNNGETHTRKGPKGTEIYKVSVKTTTDLAITGGLDRASRVIASGTTVMYHNLAKYTVTGVIDTANPLVFGSDCCYPKSGKVNLTYTGSKTGTATLQYTSCGTGTVTDSSGNSETFTNKVCL